MVVMEALGIDERSLSPPTDSYRSFYNYRDCASDHRKLEEAVSAFIADFHNEGFVHGDLRDVNLLVSATKPSSHRPSNQVPAPRSKRT